MNIRRVPVPQLSQQPLPISPRRLAGLAVAGLSALALAACSTGPTGSTGDDATAPESSAGAGDDASSSSGAADGAAADSSADTGSFPVTLTHAFGKTTVEADPQRIVTVGWSDHEIVAALGEVPVGATKINWGGNGAGSTDWFDDAVKELGADPASITRMDDSDGVPIDEIAALDPDLILGSNSGLTQEEYDKLSKIAPTVAYPEVAWGTPWRESVELVGEAIGKPDQANQAIEDTEAALADAKEAYPELEGTSFAWAWFTPTDLSTVGLYTSSDLRPQLLRDLGMVDADIVTTLSKDNPGFSANLSAEQADTLDADVLIFYTEGDFDGDNVLADPLLGQIPAMKSGAFVASSDQQAALGMSSPTPLSIPVALETFIPSVAEAAAKVQ